MELEFLAKKHDRFGWDRDRNTPAQDRQILDFMDALEDFPISEVREACAALTREKPDLMPNEGHIYQHILSKRKSATEAYRAKMNAARPETRAEREAREANIGRINPERAAKAEQIIREAGFSLKMQ